MSEEITRIEHDLSTGETKIIPLTAEELQQRELDAIEAATRKAEADAEKARIDALKASAKAKLVSGDPLTEEEASTLVI
jgi:hypothetical protein